MNASSIQVFTGIGSSRDVPEDILRTAIDLGAGLGKAGFTLRSGGARGMDRAFETGARAVKSPREIYLPWDGFDAFFGTPEAGTRRWQSRDSGIVVATDAEFQRATSVALQVWPRNRNWKHLRPGVQKLQARNSFQILGRDLDTPSAFVLYWSEGSGGTAQTLRLAERHHVPSLKVEPGLTADDVLAWYAEQTRDPGASLSLDTRESFEDRDWSEWDQPEDDYRSPLDRFDYERPEPVA